MDEDKILILLFLIVLFTVVVGISRLIIKNRKNKLEKENLRKELIETLADVYVKGRIADTKELRDFIEGFPMIERLRLSYSTDLLLIAQQLKFKLSTSNQDKVDNVLSELSLLITDIGKLIEKEKINAPFEHAPAIEKNLLLDILELSGLSNNILFRDKLNRLSEQIIIRQNTIDKLSADSSKSLKTSRLSFIWGIIFFIISIAIAIYSIAK
jgi:hypothetical protein